MDVRATRLVEDLSDVFRGELEIGALPRALYASDASLYQVLPLAVASPRDEADVLTLVRYAAEHRLPLFARGAGRGVAGESLGDGIVIDFSRHMRRVLDVGSDTVRVEPGVVHDELNRCLRPHGRYFAPDPSSASTTTIGSVLALDAAGAHSVSVGSARDHVQSIRTVLASGRCFDAQREPLSVGASSADSPVHSLKAQLAGILSRHAELIRSRRPTGLQRNRAGYWVWDVLQDGCLDLPRLLVGSEGTLALFTAATLKTLPLPEHRGAALFVFDSFDAAVRAVAHVALENPAACDLLDRRLLSLVREAAPELGRSISSSAEAALLVEWAGCSDAEVNQRLQRYELWAKQPEVQCELRLWATTSHDVQQLWSLTSRVVPLLDRLPGSTRPVPFVEDIAVPPPQLEEFIARARRILQQHEITATIYAHAAAGQLHLRPFCAVPLNGAVARLDALAHALYAAAWELGGTVNGEHGSGLARSSFLAAQYGPLYDVFREIKQLFDPQNLLNPGKVIVDDPRVPWRYLRPQAAPPPELHELQWKWTPAELQTTAARCNGCGECRTTAPGLRMCPFFRAQPHEAASPRAKANLVRHCLTGTLPLPAFSSPEFKAIADLCFNCKQCQLECPANVDIPHLVLEAKAQHVAQHGLTRSQWFLSRVPDWTDWLVRFAPLLNVLQREALTRWVLETAAGVSRHRKLPAWSRRTFLQTAPAEWLRPPAAGNGRTVVYFVDHYANAHDPEIGLALGRLLEHHGYVVHVPLRQRRSGMDLIAVGDVDAARALAEHNVKVLLDVAYDGCPIVCTEPSAAVCLKQEYPLLLGTSEAALVASRVVEAGAFLSGLLARGELRTADFKPLLLKAGYHTPCHLRALGSGEPLRELCGLIPDLSAPRIEAGCSGMAGSFGMSARDFAMSMQIGRDLCDSMQSPAVEIGLSECSSCRLQMEQTVDKPALHPLKLLAWSTGLMPAPRALRGPLRQARKS